MSKLFEPLQIGTFTTGHRVVMAPLTRYRNDDDNTPNDMVREYYEQRSAVPGTLIVSEGTLISPRGRGARNSPGIWTDEHIAGWRRVVDAVHAKGGRIFSQLWHLGRAGDIDLLNETGSALVGPSAIPWSESAPVPVEMTEEDIAVTIQDYVTAAENAMAAGFDGVEIHNANGYLLDQFLQDMSNKRTDRWGGSIENRTRLSVEVVKAVAAAIGANKTALRLSPYSDFQAMLMDEPEPTFRHLLEQLKPLGLAYLHLVEARISGNIESDCGNQRSVRWMVELWDNASPVLIAGGFTPETALKAVDETYKNYNVAIVFGRYFIANPDLVFRIKSGIPLEKYDRSTFYVNKDPKGYIDIPFSEEYKRVAAH